MTAKTVFSSGVRIARGSAVIVLFLSLGLWGWAKITDPHSFPLRDIQIRGELSHIDQHAVRRTLMPIVKQGFFAVDIPLLKQHLQQLDWIASVHVARLWPDTLKITIYQQQPVAYYGDNNLITADGALFARGTIPLHVMLPRLKGPPGQQKLMLQTLNTMNKRLTPLDLRAIVLQLSPRRSWHVTLSNGIELLLGRVDTLTRFDRFIATYPKLTADPNYKKAGFKVMYADLRYSNGMAVRWQRKTTP